MSTLTITVGEYVAATGTAKVMPRYVARYMRQVLELQSGCITGIAADEQRIVVEFWAPAPRQAKQAPNQGCARAC
jgi:hypothetical protein